MQRILDFGSDPDPGISDPDSVPYPSIHNSRTLSRIFY